MAEDVREVPVYFLKKMRDWRCWQQVYGAVNVVLGAASVVSSLLIASNRANALVTPDVVIGLSVLAGLATFLITVLNAKQYNLAFERAARELEAAITLYRSDPTMPLKSLAEAEVRGIALLNSTRTDKS